MTKGAQAGVDPTDTHTPHRHTYTPQTHIHLLRGRRVDGWMDGYAFKMNE